MPVTTRAVSRHRSRLSRTCTAHPVLMTSGSLSTRRQRFTRVRLSSAHLTGTSRLLPKRSQPRSWDRRRFRWFGPWPCSPSPRGRPSSLVQQSCS